MSETLHARLGGSDAMGAVTDDLLPRLRADPQPGRFCRIRGADGVWREKQLLVDFLCASAEGSTLLRRRGPLCYVGRDMKISHQGMGIDENDWGYSSAICGPLWINFSSRRGTRSGAGIHRQHEM